jgi:hypothetical protein
MPESKLPVVKLKDLTPEKRQELADSILTRYEKEDSIADMAKEFGISPTSVYKLLLAERPEDWKIIQGARTLHHLEQYKQAMKDAKDHLELGKAKELATRAGWELERLLAKVYGIKQETAHQQAAVHISIGIKREGGGVTLEHAAVDAPPEPVANDPKPKALKLLIHQ